MPSKAGSKDPALAKLVERQMRNWELARTQRQTVPTPQRRPVSDFITISREVGAGGKETAAILGARLGWPVFDKDILQMMAGDDAIRRKLYDSMDERDVGWFEETLRSFVDPDFKKNDYFHRLLRTVLSLARQGPGVFLGRAVDLILPRGMGFCVRLIAPLTDRIASVAARSRLPLDQAGKEVAALEQQRLDFVRRYFRAEAEEGDRYDLVVNMGHFAPPAAADLILAARQLPRKVEATGEGA